MSKETAELVKPDGKPIRALVVDDESSISDLVALALRYEKFEVRTAASGQQAVTGASPHRTTARLAWRD